MASAKRTSSGPSTAAPSRLRTILTTLFPTPAEIWEAKLGFALSILSAIVFRFAYWPYHWSPLALVALVPLLWGIRRCRPTLAFWVALPFAAIMGYVFTGGITIVDRFNSMVWWGVVPLAIWVGAHTAMAFALMIFFGRRLGPWRGAGMALLVLAGIEYFRMIGRLALPYGLVSQSMAGWPALAMVAGVGGLPLLAALVLAPNLAVMEVIAAVRAGYGQAGAVARLGVAVGAIVLAHFFGTREIAARVSAQAAAPGFDYRIALLQPNIPQEKKFASYTIENPQERFALQEEMTLQQLQQIGEIERDEVDLIVTPESSLTQDFMDVEPFLQQNLYGGAVLEQVMELATDLRTPIIVGNVDNVFADAEGNATEKLSEGLMPDGNTFRSGQKVYGATWIIRPNEPELRPNADYRKVKLMPFGEAVPYFDLIPGFQEKIVQVGTFARGRNSGPIGIPLSDDDGAPAAKLGLSICFEDLFPDHHRIHAANGANLFVNTTNDGWFDGSSIPAWHMEMARWRSIEFGIPMVRCTNTGITALIDSTGAVAQSLEPGKRGVLRTTLRLLNEPRRTIYSRIGDWFGALALLTTLVAWGIMLRRKA